MERVEGKWKMEEKKRIWERIWFLLRIRSRGAGRVGPFVEKGAGNGSRGNLVNEAIAITDVGFDGVGIPAEPVGDVVKLHAFVVESDASHDTDGVAHEALDV